MNNIISFDAVSGIVVCQAGVILSNLDSYLMERGHTVPLDLGAKGRYSYLSHSLLFLKEEK